MDLGTPAVIISFTVLHHWMDKAMCHHRHHHQQHHHLCKKFIASLLGPTAITSAVYCYVSVEIFTVKNIL